jgi:hypothetical protein
MASMGTDVSSMSDEDIQKMVAESERRFREEAPMTAVAAATVILDGVKSDRWRILVGEDARRIDDFGPPITGARLRRRFFRELCNRGQLAYPLTSQ